MAVTNIHAVKKGVCSAVEDVELVYRIIQDNTKIIFNSRNQVMHQFHGVVIYYPVSCVDLNNVLTAR